VRELDAAFAALEKEALACGPADARPVLLKLQRFRLDHQASKRPWLKRLGELEALAQAKIPTGPLPWQDLQRKITGEFRLEKKGEAQWGAAVKAWKEYLKLELPAADRQGADLALKPVELKARDEAASLVGRGVSPDELRKHRLRFEGTQAAALLDNAINGK
jgi:hypothetical protein